MGVSRFQIATLRALSELFVYHEVTLCSAILRQRAVDRDVLGTEAVHAR